MMCGGKHLKIDQIAAITSLYKSGNRNSEIHNITGINIRNVDRWTNKFRVSPNGDFFNYTRNLKVDPKL